MKSRIRIRLAGRRRRMAWWLAGVVTVAAVSSGVAVFALSRGSTTSGAHATIATVRRGTVTVNASAAGTVVAAQTRGLAFSMGEAVTEVDVKAGDSVSAGQVLARIDPTQAQDAVTAAKSQLSDAQQTLATAQQAATQAATRTTAPATTRTVAQQSGGAAPSSQSTVGAGASGDPGGTGSRGGTSGTGGTSGAGTPANGAGGSGSGGSANGTGGSGGGSANGTGGGSGGGVFSATVQVNNAQLAVSQAERQLAGTVITAPVSGKVLSVAGTVGSVPSSGSAFIVLGGLADTQVRAQFSETDVANLAVGQVATITLPDQSGKQDTGTVSQISPAGTVSGRLVLYPVLIAFDQVPAGLLYGQSANISVTTKSVSNVLYVPSSAVTGVASTGTGEGTGTVTVRSGGHDTPRSVRIGLRADQYTEVRSGLSNGEQVVITGTG